MGTTVQVNVGGEGCRLRIGKTTFFLRQFHFHTPSEHKVEAQSFSMEMHLVHTDADGAIAVLGFLFSVTDDADGGHPFLKQFWSELKALPNHKTERDVDLKPMSFSSLFAANGDMEWFRYGGSLTTPPYTEGVNWFVNKAILPMTASELRELSECWGNANNARCCQDYFGREVAMKRDVCCGHGHGDSATEW